MVGFTVCRYMMQEGEGRNQLPVLYALVTISWIFLSLLVLPWVPTVTIAE